MEVELRPTRGYMIGRVRTPATAPQWQVYIDGEYAGILPYEENSRLILCRTFAPEEIEEIEQVIRQKTKRKWLQTSSPPTSGFRVEREPELYDDFDA